MNERSTPAHPGERLAALLLPRGIAPSPFALACLALTGLAGIGTGTLAGLPLDLPNAAWAFAHGAALAYLAMGCLACTFPGRPIAGRDPTS